MQTGATVDDQVKFLVFFGTDGESFAQQPVFGGKQKFYPETLQGTELIGTEISR